MRVPSNFNDWLNEASLEGNIGLPGEGDDSPNYRANVERRAGTANREFASQNQQKIGRFMQFVSEAHEIQRGKERELEELAERTVRSLFGSILDGVELDIKIPTDSRAMKQMMEETPDDTPMEAESITDEDTIGEIRKGKIANNIVQGEAKNTKLCLQMEEVSNGLIEIFGEEQGTRMLTLLTDITNIASFFDWQIPIEMQKEMWKRRDGFAGSVKVDWEEAKADEDAEALAKKILDDIENGEDITDNEDAEKLFDTITPTIYALGSDFAMLLHEAIKGVNKLIAAVGIPEDSELSEIVIMNTDTLADELEDLRYGPYMAADLRDFINEFSEEDNFDNLRARFFGKLMEMPWRAFLEIFNGILLSRFKDSELNDAQRVIVARTKSQSRSIIDAIKKELDDYYAEPSEYSEYEPEEMEMPTQEFEPREETGDIHDAIIDAYQRGDMEEVKRLEGLIGESIVIPRLRLFKRN